jgi:hypothetical protein
MLSRVLADAVLLFHLAFVAFAVAGGLLALRWRWMVLVHLPVFAWAAFVEFSGTVCPLTPLENALRRAGGAAGYAGGFVEHYLLPMLYPDELSRTVQFALGAGLVAFNAVVYYFVWRRRKRP